MIKIADIAIETCGNDFLIPYLRKELENESECDEAVDIRGAVKIITADDDKDTPEFDAFCTHNSLPIAVLRCPYIVATGMTGLPRRIASGIYRGTYINIFGNEAEISVVHGIDVARAVNIAAGIQGTYTLTDGIDPKISELADAFAYRMGDKHIFTIKPKWARWWLGRSYYDILTTSHTAQSTFNDVFPDFSTVNVINYLRTHDYDEQSL